MTAKEKSSVLIADSFPLEILEYLVFQQWQMKCSAGLLLIVQENDRKC